MLATPETIIAFDFGLRRIGLAVGQQVTFSANSITTVKNGKKGPDWDSIESIIKEWQPDRLIVGLPTINSRETQSIESKIKIFIDQLERFSLPVQTVDENYSSLEAKSILKHNRQLGVQGKINKESIDSTAAKLIAERWLKIQSDMLTKKNK